MGTRGSRYGEIYRKRVEEVTLLDHNLRFQEKLIPIEVCKDLFDNFFRIEVSALRQHISASVFRALLFL
ncbi:hypothetical protein TRIP_B90016 [uncultured Desulfatiglans sp.]|uniref:Uncharacterized protein n=1 Tax=Uncultured Desulfatiglans sp. TaxID=1748965 RepID=A0A653AKE1_UNCDX|nr:hypothetical protein TRIP_B90016 [uncultured Desulfatiglans sp.]